MKMQILFFGIAKDLTGTSKITISTDFKMNIKELKMYLAVEFPRFKELNEYSIAVNEEYITDIHYRLSDKDVIAIIPPVSGG